MSLESIIVGTGPRFSGNSHQRRVKRRHHARYQASLFRKRDAQHRAIEQIRQGDANILEETINRHLLAEFGDDAPRFEIDC